MEPLAIVACTGGVIGQFGIIMLRFRPVFDIVCRLIDCLRNPRPPPPRAVTAAAIMEGLEALSRPHQA
ncbi:hypothetical protein EJ110_NYTH32252 [Nymphaea thermarum]|uniref:Uncharacterized protein n=1 Tax=Nymphaea colorata TaxID=210225 RepID=A0A5K1BGJ0_9MAGN|nr:hypothetical protein EJ110_NYTH32252 [Nymphaea thermarum]